MRSLQLLRKTWAPGVLVTASVLLVWGTAFNGRSVGPFRAVLVALPYGDKVGHFVLYGTIALGAAFLVRSRTQVVALGLFVIALGIGDEFRQLTEPNRNFSAGDVLANLAGVSIALLVALYAQQFTDSQHRLALQFVKAD